MNEKQNRIFSILKQLKIKYDPQNKQDIAQLKQILTNKLSYPSTQLSILHRQANRLGSLDLYNPNEIERNNDGEVAETIKKQLIYCECCGLPRQKQKLKLCTRFSNIKHIGISTRLFFMSFQHMIIITFLMLLIYGLYAIISNSYCCNYDSTHFLYNYKQNKQYLNLLQDWIFQLSLHANLACSTTTRIYQIQCWLGFVFICVCFIVLAIMKYRKYRACLVLEKLQISVDQFSLYFQNMPVNISKRQLERQLRKYRKDNLDQTIPQSKTQINIVKINRASPFYIEEKLFNDQKIKQVDEKYQHLKQQIIKLVTKRINSKQKYFSKMKEERDKLYGDFDAIKIQRIEVYKKILLQKVLFNKQQGKQGVNKIISAPTFVTFESSYNRDFLLIMKQKSQKFYQNTKQFQFTMPQTQQVIKAQYQQAPRPSQVMWQNLGQDKNKKTKLRIIVGLITLIIVTVFTIIYYFLQKLDYDFSSNQPIHTASTMTSVIALITLIMAYIICDILLYFTKKQRNITFMHEQKSLNDKYTFACVANYMLQPFLFNLIFRAQYEQLISLSQIVFILSLYAVFYYPILKIFDPIYFWTWIKLKRTMRPKNKLHYTQRELNKQYQQLQFMPGFEFGDTITSILFTCFYAPLSPIIIVFALVGMILMYIQQKYCLFNRCTRPVPGNHMVNLSVNKHLRFGPLLFSIGCLIWPYYINKQFIALVPCILSIVISTVILFIPLHKIMNKLIQNKHYIKQIVNKIQANHKKVQNIINITTNNPKQQKFYQDYKFKFRYEYDRLNYLTARQATQKYMRQREYFKQNGTEIASHIKLQDPNLINNMLSIVKKNNKKNLSSFFNYKTNMNKCKDPNLTAEEKVKLCNMLQAQIQQKQTVINQIQKQYGCIRKTYAHAYKNDDNQQLITQILAHIKQNMGQISQSKNMVFEKKLQKKHLQTGSHRQLLSPSMRL